MESSKETGQQEHSEQGEEREWQLAMKSVLKLVRNYPLLSFILSVVALIFISWIAPPAFIELLKVIISWPLVVAVLVVAFKKEIAQFIRYLVIRYRTKGGDEFSLFSQAARAFAESSEADLKIEPNPADTQVLRDQIDKLIQVANDVTQEKQQIMQTAVQLLEQQTKTAVYWWCCYLSYALVYRTKVVLNWFARKWAGISPDEYKAFWKQYILEPDELEAVFVALKDHGLIAPDDQGSYWVTEAGRSFVAFLHSKGFFAPPSWRG